MFIIFRGGKKSLLKLTIITHTHKGSKPSSPLKLLEKVASLGCFLELVCKRVPSGSPALQNSIVQDTTSLPGSFSLMRVLSFTIRSCRQQSDQLIVHNTTEEATETQNGFFFALFKYKRTV